MRLRGRKALRALSLDPSRSMPMTRSKSTTAPLLFGTTKSGEIVIVHPKLSKAAYSTEKTAASKQLSPH